MKLNIRKEFIAVDAEYMTYFVRPKTWNGANWISKKRDDGTLTHKDLLKISEYAIDNDALVVAKNRTRLKVKDDWKTTFKSEDDSIKKGWSPQY